MSDSRVPGSFFTSAIGTRWVSMIAVAAPVRRVLLRSWRSTLGRRSVSCQTRPVVLLTLIVLFASVAFSASLVPLAAPASATAPAAVPVVDTEVTTPGGYVSLSGIGDVNHPDPSVVLDTPPRGGCPLRASRGR
jgi:hypothetical protein